MKTIHIEDDLYQYIASQTQNIGESASEILRRLLLGDSEAPVPVTAETITTDNVKVDAKKEASTEQPESRDDSTSALTLVDKKEVANQKGAVGRFMYILSLLHRCHSQDFSRLLNIKGSKRSYFSLTAEMFNETGSEIKTKQIPESEYWVVTNNNTSRKKVIINEAALALGYQQADADTLKEFI